MNRNQEQERSVPTDGDKASAPQAGGDSGGPGAADVQAYIGRQLRAVYDDVAKQPIPDRFLALMKRLEQQTAED